ncbi:MAG TPA: pectin lyase fold-containing protein, partial [Burkholderiaceae bacterium]
MKCQSLTLVAACLPAFAAAQDARHVTEPAVPAVCTTLKAMLDSSGAANADDTVRLQQAIDHCPAGQAVRLASDNAHAFLSGPLVLRAGVGMVIDPGVVLYAS